METRSYRFGDLREKLRESASEFKPVFGDGVESAEKDLNRKAYQGMKKETSEYNKGIKSPGGDNRTKSVNAELNMGMSDIEYDNEVGKTFEDNAKAGYEGYTSALDKKNHEKEELGNGNRNQELAKELVDKAKETKKEKDSFSEVGITNAQKPKDATHLHQDVVESKKTPLLKFKHVQFISESQMISHIPDEYKVEGKRFYMQDCKGNKYLVEWHDKPGVEKKLNESSVQTEMTRIKELFNYNGKNTSTTNSMRINENRGVEDMLVRVRALMK
jgi:hypothetical protein